MLERADKPNKQENQSGDNNQPNTNNSGSSNKYNELERLAGLKEKGVITQEEFDFEKKKLLNQNTGNNENEKQKSNYDNVLGENVNKQNIVENNESIIEDFLSYTKNNIGLFVLYIFFGTFLTLNFFLALPFYLYEFFGISYMFTGNSVILFLFFIIFFFMMLWSAYSDAKHNGHRYPISYTFIGVLIGLISTISISSLLDSKNDFTISYITSLGWYYSFHSDNFTREYNNKGLALRKLGKYEEAIEYYDKALDIEPNNSTHLLNKGLALRKLGKYEEAIEYYDIVLKNEPNDVIALAGKGYALDELGKYGEAIKYYNKALEIRPFSEKIQNKKEEAQNALGR